MPFEVPAGAELGPRLASVLEVVYLIFNEGYSATAGEDWMRPGAVRGRAAARPHPGRAAPARARGARPGRADGDPGLAHRRRGGPAGEPVLLLDQDRSRWDRLLIGRGLAALARAERLGGGLGPYALQAAIAACHARAAPRSDTDWARIAALYAALAPLTPSPVVELNRAVAVAMAYGPGGGAGDRRRARRRAARSTTTTCCRACAADLLARLGRVDEARAEFERAAGLTPNESERRLLSQRAAEL